MNSTSSEYIKQEFGQGESTSGIVIQHDSVLSTSSAPGLGVKHERCVNPAAAFAAQSASRLQSKGPLDDPRTSTSSTSSGTMEMDGPNDHVMKEVKKEELESARSSTPRSSVEGEKHSLPQTVNSLMRCRYKTGKCSNIRSNKRNGQLHQLCLHHREKANKIQRKFDRQKRLQARANKNKTRKSMEFNAATMPQSSMGYKAQEFDMNTSDSDLSRISTDSESSVLFDDFWSNVPASVVNNITGSNPTNVNVPTTTMSFDRNPVLMSTRRSLDSALGTVTMSFDHEPVMMDERQGVDGRLSVDEIDFLCSAMLD